MRGCLHREDLSLRPAAALVPVDLAVGWGPMSDQAVLDQLTDQPELRASSTMNTRASRRSRSEEIISHSTNLHLIPSTDAIAAQCKSLRSGELIHLSGLLVEATGPEIGTWRSSLSRTDSGNGACELVWVRGNSTDRAPISAGAVTRKRASLRFRTMQPCRLALPFVRQRPGCVVCPSRLMVNP